MIGKILSCRSILGSIGRSKLPSIAELIIYLLENFALIAFVLELTFFSWAATAINFSVHPESAKAGFASFGCGQFLCSALKQYCYIYVHYHFQFKYHH